MNNPSSAAPEENNHKPNALKALLHKEKCPARPFDFQLLYPPLKRDGARPRLTLTEKTFSSRKENSLIAALRKQRNCIHKIIKGANKKQPSAKTAGGELCFSSACSPAKASPSPIKLRQDRAQKKRL